MGIFDIVKDLGSITKDVVDIAVAPVEVITGVTKDMTKEVVDVVKDAKESITGKR